MKNFIFCFVFSICVNCFGNDIEEMRSVLEANFAACNNEDADALLDTCSIDMPRREDFRIDSINLWREKDIYYQLVDFQVLRIHKDYAIARVVQLSHTKDRTSANRKDEFIRNGTGLLTLKECVEYQVAFKKDKGFWKCYLTLTEPVEYKSR